MVGLIIDNNLFSKYNYHPMIDLFRIDKIGNLFPLYLFLFGFLYFSLRNHPIIILIIFAILYYINRETITTLLDKVDKDEFVMIKRDNGVKKTTLLNIEDLRNIFKRLKSFRRYNHSS